jgi:hypothetical protein
MHFKNPEINRLFNLISKKRYNDNVILNKSFFAKFVDERDVEIPYLLSRYSGQKKILEVGLSLADKTLIKVLINLKKINKTTLFGLDIIDIKKTLHRFKTLEIKKNFKFIHGNAINIKFNTKFDLISLISTLEHIGFDKVNNDKKIKGVFNRKKKLTKIKNNKNDFKAIKNLSKSLIKNGKIILTVPFGSREIIYTKDCFGFYAFYREYNYRRIFSIIKFSKLSLKNIEVYNYQKKWKKIKKISNFKNISLPHSSKVRTVACIELQKN